MKKYKTELICVLVLVIAIYVLTAFIQLTFDFTQWSLETRGLVVGGWFFAVFSYLATITVNRA